MPAPKVLHDALDVLFDGAELDEHGASTSAAVDGDAIELIDRIAPREAPRAEVAAHFLHALATSRRRVRP